MLMNNSRRALWITVLVFALVIVAGSGFAQTVKPRLGVSSAAVLSTTNFNLLASAATSETPDRLESRKDPTAEVRRRQMVDSLAAERLRRLPAALAAAAAPVQIPQVQGLPIQEKAKRFFAFPGISNFTQANANAGFSVEPPDQALCVGNGFVLEAVNDAVALYSYGGVSLVGVAPLNPFFGQLPEDNPLAINLSDPRCLYDPATDRWFVTVIAYPNDLSSSHLLIAVSKTGNPALDWKIYALDVTNDGSDFFPGDCPCLGDQPLIGANADGFYLSTNAFGSLSFQGAQVYVLSKSALAHSALNVPVVHIDQLSFFLPDIEFSFSLQPSFSPPGDPGEKGTEYFVQGMRARRLEQRVGVWAIGNTAAIDRPSPEANLTVSLAVIPSQVYAAPVSATQKPGPTPLAERAARDDSAPGDASEQNLDGNDHRMQQVMFAQGKLWTAVGTALTAPGSPVRTGVGWFVIDVKNPSTGLQAKISKQGYVAGAANSHLLYPAVGVNADGRAVMVFTVTGPQFFPSAAYWSFGDESIHIVASGNEPEDGFSAYYFARPRWGDYSAAAVAADGTIWMATEMIPGGRRKTSANWGTFVARVPAEREGD